MNESSAVKSATRVLDMLETLAVATGPVGASELARRLGIPKSSTHMLLATLEGRGYVVGDDVRRFRLHPLYDGPSRSWIGGALGALRSLAAEPMRRLARLTGESAFLGVPRDATSFEYVDKVVSAHEVRCDAALGDRRVLHASSVGLVLLAMGPPDKTARYLASHALERPTPRTVSDAQRLDRELAIVREQGYAVTRDTNAVGASGIAAPVFGPDGRLLGALNVSAPTSRFDALIAHVDALAGAAKQLTADIAVAAGRLA